MQDCWYGDKRDVVKWSVLIETARKHRIKHLLWVVFYRSAKPETVLDEVWTHFRDIHQIEQLGKSVDLGIDVFDQPWGGKREAYIHDVLKRIVKPRAAPLLVFLDPDTGLGKGITHVKDTELEEIFREMLPGDILVFYQHAQRRKDWQNATRDLFAKAIKLPADRVAPAPNSLDIAKDVIFFIATR